METFDPQLLKRLRQEKGMTIATLARQLGTSTTQIHRLENGQRRLTVATLFAICRVLETRPSDLFEFSGSVPVTGAVDDSHEVQPMSPTTENRVVSPRLVQDMQNVAALRWEPKEKLIQMQGHYLFYYAHNDGITEQSWGNRCLLLLKNGRQRIGWPIRDGELTHIDNHEGRAEFNVQLIWASPILAVVPPFLISRLKSLSSLNEE